METEQASQRKSVACALGSKGLDMRIEVEVACALDEHAHRS